MSPGVLEKALVATGLAVFLAVPLFVSGVVSLHIFILIFYFAYLASAWNVVALAGQH